MKIKKAIKKIVALGAGATMVGATLLGAMATDLSNYPAPFVQDGSINNAMIVVGANAATSDVIGAIDISASLQAAAYSEEEVSTGTSETTVTGGEVEDKLVFGLAPWSGNKSYDDGDIAVLSDSDVRYNSVDRDYKETIFIENGALIAQSGEDHEEYGIAPFVEVEDSKALYYRYTFDTALPFNSSADADLDISFLGMDLQITGSAASNKVTLSAAETKWFAHGEEITATVSGVDYTIKLVGVYSTTEAMVSVNGEQKLMTDGDTDSWGYDNFELELTDAVNDDSTANDIAKIKYGTKASETAENSKTAEVLGQGNKDDEAEWVWDISTDADGNISYVGVQYSQDRNRIASELSEDYQLPALAEGDCISFPNSFAEVCFTQTRNNAEGREEFTVTNDKVNEWKDDNGMTIFDDEDQVLTFSSSAGKDIFKVGSDKYSKVMVGKDMGDIGLTDSAGTKTNTSFSRTALSIEVDDESKAVILSNSTGGSTGTLAYVEFSAIGNTTAYTGTWSAALNWTLNWTEDDDSVAGELALGGTNVGTRDYSFMTDYGVQITDPKSTLQNGYGYVKLSYPDEKMTWDLTVGGAASTGTTGGATSQSINWVGLGLGVLDSDASSDAGNLIVVGGPCANSVAAELMGSTSDNCADGFSEGQAKIKLYNTGDNMALLVAGYSATDTRAASRAVANYASEDFSGDELAVTVLSATDYSLGAPAAEEEEAEADATETGE